MKKIFVDCDVAHDLLAKREPFYIDAATLFDEIYTGDLLGYVSSLSYSHLYYFLHKLYDKRTTLSLLKDFRKVVSISAVDEHIVDKSLENSFADFEDALQYQSAISIKADYIITRNKRDFKESKIKVLTPKEFLAL